VEERREEIAKQEAHTALELALSCPVKELRQSEKAAWRGVQNAERLRTHVVTALEEQLARARACQDTTELREMVLQTVRTTSRDALCVKAVQIAVRAGVDVNARTVGLTGEGWLMVAARNGLVETARTLLAAGAEVDRADNRGGTALHLAARHGHVQVMRVLLEAGAEVDRRGGQEYKGPLPLYLAAAYGHVEAMRVLLEAGADARSTADIGTTALHGAASRGQVEAMRVLLQAGAEVDQVDSKGCSALHLASYSGRVDAIRLLVQRGADPNRASTNGSTPLSVARTKLQYAAAQALEQLGATQSNVPAPPPPPHIPPPGATYLAEVPRPPTWR
jgi:ankyrin repeat protein